MSQSKFQQDRTVETTRFQFSPAWAVLLLAGLGFANLTERRENRYLQSRTKTRLGEDWKVYAGGDPAGAKDATFNDASWATVSVPHDMSIALVGKTTDIDPGNKGWYRKHFTLPAGATGKRVTLQFDGVFHWCKVYVNGTLVGSQEFGYVSFQVDITNALKATGDNVIAVWVDNLTQRQSRWYSGTGIYRHVWMTMTDPVHVRNWGTAVTTDGATAAKSTVKINTDVTNDGSASATRTLRTVICDSTGSPVDSVSSSVTVAAGATTTFTQSLDLAGVKLWSPETPYIYNAYTKILDGAKVGDDYVTPFGIRDLQFSVAKGMTINGVTTKMRGACMHHTMVPTGAVVPEQMWVRVLTELKASGTNSIRTAHNPTSPEFLDLCDRMGFLIMNEWCDKWKDWWAGSQYLDWDKVWKADLKLFLERDRNHPSVVMWSYGNEVATSATGGAMPQYEYTMSGTIVPYAKTIDKSRPYTHGVANGFSGDWAGYAKLAQYEDIVGVNYNDGGYSNMISLAPNALFVGTEQYPYGNSWGNAKNRSQVIGEQIWTGMDYLGEVKPMGEPCGFLDVCAFRKTWFYYRKSIIGGEPVVKLGVGSPNGSGAWAPPILSESWNESGSKNVVAYSNCQSVSLYLNGTLVGTKTYTAGNLSTSQWTVNWASGTLKVVGSNGGTQVAVDSLITTGAASKIVLKSDRTTLYADGDDVANIEAYVVDAAGHHIWSATNNLKYTVSGAGRGWGVGTGDLTKTVPYSDNRNAYEGRAYIPIQSTPTPGSITVTVSSNGLTAGTVTLTTVPQPASGTPTGVVAKAARGATVNFARKSGAHAMEMGYHIDKSGPVRISVLTPAGQEVASFDQGVQASGFHTWVWNKVPGERAYLVRVKAEGMSATQFVAMP